MPPNHQANEKSPENSNQIRTIKQLGLRPISNEKFLNALDFLSSVASVNLKTKKTEFDTTLTTNQGEAIKNLLPALLSNQASGDQPPKNSIQFVYQKVDNAQDFNQYLLPADIVFFLYNLLTEFADFHRTSLQKPEFKQVGSNLENFKNLVFQSYISQWTNSQISFQQELALTESLFNSNQVKELLTSGVGLVLTAAEALTKLAESEAASSESSDESDSKEAEEDATSRKSTVAQPETEGSEQTDSSQQTDQEAQDQTPSITPEEFNKQIDLFSTSFSYVVANSILAAYAVDSAGKQLVSLQGLSPELNSVLIQQFAPHIKKIIYSLNSEELKQLLEGGANASAVRLKILQQAHRFATRNATLKLLTQQAFNEALTGAHGTSALSDGEKQTLATSIKNTPHSNAEQRLAKIAGQDIEFTEEQKGQLSALSSFALLSANNYKLDFTNHIKKIVGGDIADESKINLARSNLDSSLTSLAIADPLMGEFFIDHLDYSRFSNLFGDVFSRNQFEQNKNQIRILFKQYWVYYRQEINQLYPEMGTLSDMSPGNQDVEKNRALDLLDETDWVRSHIKQSSDFSGEENPIAGRKTLDYWAGIEIELEKLSNEERQVLEEIQKRKISIWNKISQKEQELYQSLVNQQLQEIKLEKLNYFALTQAIALHQQAEIISRVQAAEQASWIQNTLRLNSAQQEVAYAQNLALLQSQRYLVPEESVAAGLPPEMTAQGTAPQGQYGVPGTGMVKNAANTLANKGVDAGLTYITGGGWAAVPAPLRHAVNQKIVSKIKPILKAIGALVAAKAAAIISLIHKARTAATLGEAIVAGSKAGSLMLGPLGTITGGAIAGGAHIFGGAVKNPEAAASTAAETISTNVGETASGFGHELKRQAGLGPRATQLSPEAGGMAEASALEAGATGSGLGATVGAGLTAAITSPAALPAALSVATPVLISLLVFTQIAASFLIDPGIDYLQRAGVSFFADISKTATIVGGNSDCLGKTSCPNPTFPIEVEYTITLTPKNNSTITILDITDTISVTYNKSAYENEDRTAPENQTIVRSAEDLEALELINQEIAEPITITYQETHTSQHDHSLIRNVVDISFAYISPSEQGEEFVRGTASLTFGDAPRGNLCWPIGGNITQTPYFHYTHQGADAYDIAPTTRSDYDVYAPIDGLLCAGRWGVEGHSLWNERFYGEHVSIRTEIDNEEYVFLFAHFVRGTARVTDRSCRNVSQGEIIGRTGSTGRSSTGTHLHFERIENDSRSLTELMTGVLGAPIITGAIRENLCSDL